MGPAGQLTPPVNETETEPAALPYGRGQSSPTANLPAVTSLRDLLNLAHTLHYLVGPLVGASDCGAAKGGAEVRVDGVTPVEATAKQAQTLTSFYGLRRP